MSRMIDIASKNGEDTTHLKRGVSQVENMSSQPEHEHTRNMGKLWKFIFFIAILIIAGKVLVYFNVLPSNSFPRVDVTKWQTVFLLNGQAYFGHLKEINQAYVVLSDVYYLQNDNTNKEKPSFVIQKHGNEIHGPENIMYIPKSQILFWENLRPDSGVMEVINKDAVQE